MTAESPTIRLERYSERHVEGLTALYNDPAVARQVLQMPYQSVEQRRKRLHDSVDDDRLLILVALHQGGRHRQRQPRTAPAHPPQPQRQHRPGRRRRLAGQGCR